MPKQNAVTFIAWRLCAASCDKQPGPRGLVPPEVCLPHLPATPKGGKHHPCHSGLDTGLPGLMVLLGCFLCPVVGADWWRSCLLWWWGCRGKVFFNKTGLQVAVHLALTARNLDLNLRAKWLYYLLVFGTQERVWPLLRRCQTTTG